jgi:hypothetical protein
MNIVPTNFTVADYCNALNRGDITVNRIYQRSNKVWPDIAKSFLIETIICGYPVPKLSLYQTLDLKSRRTVKEIVDGQQRTAALVEFFDNSLRLSRSLETEDIAGRTLSELGDEHQAAFLHYGLSVDLFVGARPEDVREIFRRINSYTVPLNPEEQRHSQFQGPFKWFIYRLTKEYDTALVNMGAFTEKQIIRMADAKLYTETTHALVNGITTTNKKSLDKLYRENDQVFQGEERIQRQIQTALDHLIAWTGVHSTRLMKPYVLYSLLLAVTHAEQPAKELTIEQAPGGEGLLDGRLLQQNLSVLADALENPEIDIIPELAARFREASEAKTNTGKNRITRFLVLYKALTSGI